MSIQKKIALYMACVLLTIFGIWTTISIHQQGQLLKDIGESSKAALRRGAVNQARSIVSSLDAGMRGTMMLGEMDLFAELLVELGKTPNVLEIGLANTKGRIEFANRPELVHQAVDSETFNAAAAGQHQISEKDDGDSMLLLGDIRFQEKCLECHTESKVGGLAGVLHVRYSMNELLRSEKEMEAFLSAANNESIWSGSITAVVGLLLTCLILYPLLGKMVRKPLNLLENMINELGKGHLDERLKIDSKDEVGQIARVVNDFADSLKYQVVDCLQKLANGDLTFEVHPVDGKDVVRGALSKLSDDLNAIISRIQDTGALIVEHSVQVSDSSQTLSEGATQQAASIEEISASMTELAAQTKLNAENASQASLISEQARKAAGQGSSQMQAMVQAMVGISESSQNVSRIIKTIDEIAFQTNLLALNAAVEAARAGQHGKGFAVVAEEVRNLAARSAKAAQETSELIEGSVQRTEAGAQIADATATSLSAIVAEITMVTDLVSEIAAASNEQAHGIAQVNLGLGQIDQVTQRNTANAEASAAAAEELSSHSQQMQQMLAHFTLKNPNGKVPLQLRR
jgi:methyl-accepting chemotaxis protein